MHSDLWNSISTNYCRYYEKQVECDNKLVSVKKKKTYIMISFFGGGRGGAIGISPMASNWLETALLEVHI